MAEIVECGDALGRERRHSARKPRLLGRIERQQVCHPEHQPRRRLVAGEDHRRGLVAHLVGGRAARPSRDRGPRAGDRADRGGRLRGARVCRSATRSSTAAASASGRHAAAQCEEKEVSDLANPSSTCGRPGPVTYWRTRSPIRSRSALSGSENSARSTAFKAAAWKASERSARRMTVELADQVIGRRDEVRQQEFTLCGVNAGDSRRRCRRHSPPSARNRPWPASGRMMRVMITGRT